MLGLIRNNFYSAESDLKLIYPLCFIAMIAAVILRDPQFTYIVALAQLVACFGHIGTGLKKDCISKWNKYEITLPIKRCEIIGARYLSFLLFALIGLAFSLATFTLTHLTGVILSVERITYILSFGTAMIVIAPALMYPALLQFGADKSEQFTMYALVAVMGIAVGGGELAKVVFPSINDMLFRLFLIILSLAIFVISYFLSLYLYKKKDLT